MICKEKVKKIVPKKMSLLVSRQDYAYEMIKKMIIRGMIPKGERVVERQVSEALGLSRVPVREALLRLSTEGVLVSIPKGGFIVRAYSKAEVVNLYQLRDAVESYAARLVAEKGKAEDIAVCNSLHANLVKMRDSDIDVEYYDYDELFHRSILKASGNDRMNDLFNILHYQHLCLTINDLDRKQSESNYLRKRNVLDFIVRDHEKVLDAINRHDGSGAAAAMSEHINLALIKALKFIERE